ncbi:MAG TPA: hypothetical protein VLT90_13135 [Terriglobales bacterium]|nr:hypothetical protein [Terriglobales bacterium]
MATPNHLERGGRKFALVRDLAKGEQTQRQLAARYGVSQPAISQFAQRYAEEILETRANIDDKLIGLWVADKSARIAEYQDGIEKLKEIIAELTDSESKESALVRAQVSGLMRTMQAGLRAVADELGSIPVKSLTVTGAQVTYTVEATQQELEGLD